MKKKKKKSFRNKMDRYAAVFKPTEEEYQVYRDQVLASGGFDVDYWPVHEKIVGLITPADLEDVIEEYKHFVEMAAAEACKVYEQELEDWEIVKATMQDTGLTVDYYITLTAKACLDGVTRFYQAKFTRTYDFDAPESEMLEDTVEFVRLKLGDPPHVVAE